MFGKTKKIDSKVRFQQPGFRKQLQHAREYKRVQIGISDNKLAKFLRRVGFGSIWSQIITLLILLALIYLLYVPNFLSIKHVDIHGLSPQQQQKAQALVEKYFANQPLLAQKNYFLLSKNRLQSYLLAHDSDIFQITATKKSFPNSLAVAAVPRTIQFVVQTPLEQLLVSNDGLIQEKLPQSATSTLLQTLIAIHLQNAETTDPGTQLFAPDTLQKLIVFKTTIEKTLQMPVNYLSLDQPASQDAGAMLQTGFIIKFTIQSNPQIVTGQAQLILNNLGGNQKNLYYIDMRFEDKGFACLKNTPCAQPQQLLQLTPTSTNSQ